MNRWFPLIFPLSCVLSVAFFFAIMAVVPIEWGSFSMKPARTVTVYGQSQEKRTNEIASYNAGVNEVDADKQKAIDKVNTTVDTILEQVKAFGIPEEDIQTQNISINRIDDAYNLNNPSSQVKWAANNSIEITLRDVTKANELADILARSGATNVYGPNFRLDDEVRSEDELLQSAIEDAREKAQGVANASGARLGKILTVDETLTQQSYPVMMRDSAGFGGGAPMAVEPGTSTVSKSVLVIFELR